MKILFIAHRIPYPPNKGDKIRSFHQVRLLSRGHSVHLACLVDKKEDWQHIGTLEKYCTSVDAAHRGKTISMLRAVKALFTSTPLSVASFYSRKLARKIDRRINAEKFDIIIVFSSAMAQYVKHIKHIPKVMDFVDVDSEKWRLYADRCPLAISWICRLEANRLAHYEEEVAKVFDHSIFVSEKEACLFQRRIDDRPISVVPNGVDLDYFHPNGSDSLRAHPPVIVFTGTMDYFPNVDAVKYFCEEILPVVRREMPEVRFYIVGRNPIRQVKALSRLQNVIVTGFVTDVRPYLAMASVVVAPFRIARGVQNKILEAMAMGLPVVGTPMAFQGIQATATEGTRIASAPQGFAQEVLILLKDHTLRNQCSLQTRHYVQGHHRWEEHGASLESLLQGTINQHAFHPGGEGWSG